MNAKKRILLNAGNLTPDMQHALEMQYPFGVDSAVQSIRDAKGKRRLAVLLDTNDTTFLVWFNPNQLETLIPLDTQGTSTGSWDDDDPEEGNDMDEFPEE